MPAEKTFDRTGLDEIVGLRRRAVRVDVVNFEPFDAAPRERMRHALHDSRAVRLRGHGVKRLARAPVTEHLRIDPRATRDGVPELLHHHKGGPLAEHKTAARDVERLHRFTRVALVRGHHFPLAKSAPNLRDDRRLRSAGDHHIRLIAPDHRERVAHHIVAARTAAAERDGVPLDAQLDGDLPAAAAAVAIDHREK